MHTVKYDTSTGQVKEITSSLKVGGSHVMEYSDKSFKDEILYLYQRFDPSNTVTKTGFWANKLESQLE
jgi:hypothetical protein